MIKLSPRHEAILSFVPPGARVLDVGTDHGLVPIALLKRGIAKAVLASDANTGPLARAKANMRTYGVSFPLYLADGLLGIPLENADTVIIAGMGGELIARIISEVPLHHRLILCPHTKASELRRADIHILNEKLAEDNGRIYPVIEAVQGKNNIQCKEDFYISPLWVSDPLFPLWLERELEKTEQIIAAISRGENSKEAMEKQLWYKGVLERYGSNLRRNS